MSPALFSEFALGGLHLKNRVAVSPMAQYSGRNGVAQPWHLQHLGSVAVSGPGLVIIESTSVELEGAGSAVNLRLYTDEQEAGLRGLLAGVRSFADAKIGIQFGHAGRKAAARLPSASRGPDGVAIEVERPVFGPSALPYGSGWPVPTALDEEGLARVRAAYVQAAARAARLDLDLIEVHGAHGYLLHSFLSPVSNQRTDRYGGSLDNRMRFVVEVMSGIRAVWPSPRALGIRLNSRDWVEGGMTVDDTVVVAAALKCAGVDYVCVSAGAISDRAAISASPGYLALDAARIRREAGIAMMVTGMIIEPDMAEGIIREGQADVVAIGRGFLDNPRWVWHAAQHLGADLAFPMQYERSNPKSWPGATILRRKAAV